MAPVLPGTPRLAEHPALLGAVLKPSASPALQTKAELGGSPVLRLSRIGQRELPHTLPTFVQRCSLRRRFAFARCFAAGSGAALEQPRPHVPTLRPPARPTPKENQRP